MNTQTLELDLTKDGLGGNVVRVGQGDKSGTTIKAYIYDGGADAALSGYTGYLEVRLPNKRNYYRAACTISGNVATVTLDESKLCSVVGYTDEAYFTFEKNGVKYSTERFAFDILRCATDGIKPAQNWDDAIDSIITRGNAAVSAANTAAANAQDAADAANAAADRVDASITNAEAATDAANSAAVAANSAANAARTATSSANEAASKANTNATAAKAATEKANTAATNAQDAADAATDAAKRVETDIKDVNAAVDAAEKAADKANKATTNANNAADDATAAAKKALSLINGISGYVPSGGGGGGANSADVEALKKDNATLAALISSLHDQYVVIDETAFTPTSRVAAIADETLTLTNATFADGVATLS